MTEPQPAKTEPIALTPPADTATIAELRRRARRLRRLNQMSWALIFIGLPIYALPAIAILFGSRIGLPLWASLRGTFCTMSGAFRMPLAARWRETTKSLAEATALEAFGPLIEGLEIVDECGFVMEMLAQLLSRLQTNDAHFLTPRYHRILNRQLDGKNYFPYASRTPFIIATLKAYEQIGGKDDLPTVERLANGAGYAKRNKAIRKAAQECLPYLQARSEQQSSRQTLLRASSEIADNPTNLLRPAHAVNITDPAQLLRASGSEAPE